ncbi:hypothetical protein B0J14DRAFT_591963 [Halenospora varia]|nr:hypothetical protein B0J14DRAFT_591963 [Halenospora varia]
MTGAYPNAHWKSMVMFPSGTLELPSSTDQQTNKLRKEAHNARLASHELVLLLLLLLLLLLRLLLFLFLFLLLLLGTQVCFEAHMNSSTQRTHALERSVGILLCFKEKPNNRERAGRERSTGVPRRAPKATTATRGVVAGAVRTACQQTANAAEAGHVLTSSTLAMGSSWWRWWCWRWRGWRGWRGRRRRRLGSLARECAQRARLWWLWGHCCCCCYWKPSKRRGARPTIK